jgi:hypothetical protein
MRHLSLNTIVTIIAIIVIGVISIPYFLKLSPPQLPTMPQAYTNTTYGYSFDYPGKLAVKEYSPAYVAVGTSTGETFTAAANIDVLSSDPSDPKSESFNDFLYRQAINMCAADGPSASISCTGVASSTEATTPGGLSGELFSLTEVTTAIPSGATSTLIRGPFFAFNISANVPDKKYTALIVHVPIALPQTEVDVATIQLIVDSLSINKVDVGEGNASTTIEAGIGGNAHSGAVTIVPLKVLEDSRCATDVECIQAGTVKLQAMLGSGGGSATTTFTMGQAITTEAEQVTLTDVSPKPNSKTTIDPSDYIFTFTVAKR